MREKKKVKNELKIYDQSLHHKFKRVPSRAEKEPMRSLYMYYKRLKQCIAKKQATGDRGSGNASEGEAASRQAAVHLSTQASSELGSAPGSRAGSHVSGRSMASAQSGVSLTSGISAGTEGGRAGGCLLYTSPSPRDRQKSRMPSSA